MGRICWRTLKRQLCYLPKGENLLNSKEGVLVRCKASEGRVLYEACGEPGGAA